MLALASNSKAKSGAEKAAAEILRVNLSILTSEKESWLQKYNRSMGAQELTCGVSFNNISESYRREEKRLGDITGKNHV
jgi:hypothetical protein